MEVIIDHANESICCVDDCCNKVYAKNLCRRHYDKMRNYGDPLHKTRKDKNLMNVCGDFAEILLSNVDEIAIIDLEDVDKIRPYKWYKNSDGYVAATIHKKSVRLHSFLLGDIGNSNVADHKDRNKLNNRKSNLRVTTQLKNAQNRGMQSNNRSGAVGVIWHKSLKKWCAYITVNKQRISLGTFDSFEDAKESRIIAEKKYFGEFRSNANGENKN